MRSVDQIYESMKHNHFDVSFELKSWKPIPLCPDQNLILASPEEVEMYKELCGVKEWPCVDFSVTAYKLQYGCDFSIESVMDFITRLLRTRFCRNNMQIIFCRELPGEYKIYVNILELVPYILKHVCGLKYEIVEIMYAGESGEYANKKNRKTGQKLFESAADFCSTIALNKFEFFKNNWCYTNNDRATIEYAVLVAEDIQKKSEFKKLLALQTQAMKYTEKAYGDALPSYCSYGLYFGISDLHDQFFPVCDFEHVLS